MQTKDYLTLGFSLLALIFSILTLAQKVYEIRRTTRSQITEVMSKLLSANIELEKIRVEIEKDGMTLQSGVMLDKHKRLNHSLAQQADYLMRKKPSLVSAVEYANLAIAFETVNDPYMADLYWNLAIKATSTFFNVEGDWIEALTERDESGEENQGYNLNYLKAMFTRRYGAFLYSMGKQKEGNEKFNDAVMLLNLDEDRAHWEKGFLYRKWAHNVLQENLKIDEFQNRKNEVNLLLVKSRQAYKDIKNLSLNLTLSPTNNRASEVQH